MRSYTTLGTGKNAKVLSVPEYGTSRTVTSLPADRADQVAFALQRTDRQLPAALYQPAVALNGKPYEARRHLLSVFDQTAAGTPWTVTREDWAAAEEVVVALGTATAGLPAPVVAALRTELAEHLYGFDGVLVPARVSSQRHRGGKLSLTVSGPLHWLSDDFWACMAGPGGDLVLLEDDPRHPLGGRLAFSHALHQVVMELADAEPTRHAPFEDSVADILAAGSDNDMVDLDVRADHLLAFVRNHKPDLTGELEPALAG